jgi:homoserine kinase
MVDVIVGPAREGLIPGYHDARKVALAAGAVGFGIAGSGPSVFAWSASADTARTIERDMVRAFARAGLESDAWISPVSPGGAHVES